MQGLVWGLNKVLFLPQTPVWSSKTWRKRHFTASEGCISSVLRWSPLKVKVALIFTTLHNWAWAGMPHHWLIKPVPHLTAGGISFLPACISIPNVHARFWLTFWYQIEHVILFISSTDNAGLAKHSHQYYPVLFIYYAICSGCCMLEVLRWTLNYWATCLSATHIPTQIRWKLKFLFCKHVVESE